MRTGSAGQNVQASKLPTLITTAAFLSWIRQPSNSFSMETPARRDRHTPGFLGDRSDLASVGWRCRLLNHDGKATA